MRGDDWNLLELWELAAWPCVCQESEVTPLLHSQGGALTLARAIALLNSSLTFHTGSDPPEGTGLRQKLGLGQSKGNSNKSSSYQCYFITLLILKNKQAGMIFNVYVQQKEKSLSSLNSASALKWSYDVEVGGQEPRVAWNKTLLCVINQMNCHVPCDEPQYLSFIQDHVKVIWRCKLVTKGSQWANWWYQETCDQEQAALFLFGSYEILWKWALWEKARGAQGVLYRFMGTLH